MLKKFLFIVALLSLISLVYSVFDYYRFTADRNQLVEQKGLETSANLRGQVDELLTRIVKEGERLASRFEQEALSSGEVMEIIKQSSLSIDEIQGVTAGYEPYALTNNQRLFCQYFNKGSNDFLDVAASYDYTIEGKKSTAWYTDVREKGAKWVEPYYAQAAKDWYIDYGVPFYHRSGPNKGKVKGTITMSFVASGFKKIVHDLSLGKTGYGIITSNNGIYLSHPINEYIGKRNIKVDLAEEKVPALKNAFEAIIEGKQGFETFYDKDVQDNTLIYFDKIPTSGWGMGVVFYKNDLLDDDAELRRRYIRMSLLLSLFLLFIIAIYFNKDYLDRQEIWQLSFLASFLLLGNIVLIGYLQHQTVRTIDVDSSPPIVDMTGLGSYANQVNQRALALKEIPPTQIPTGVYIEQLEFEDSYNLNVGGMVWQKYPIELIDKIDEGFRFPQISPFAESEYIEETSRDTIRSVEGAEAFIRIAWEFRVTLRLNLKYSDFPFEKRQLNIELVPKSQMDNLMFAPDLVSYAFTNPSRKSGLNKNIELSGNRILESYFNYTTQSYDSDFGYGAASNFEEVPILHYNIHLRRVLLNAFVTYLIPIFVALVMMFILLIACGKTEERQGIIESMAAFFFVLIFSHIDLRKEVVTADLMYMEYFYFITYLMIILSSFNLIIYTKDKWPIFDHNENQVFKAIYFPLFWLLLLMVTLAKFY